MRNVACRLRASRWIGILRSAVNVMTNTAKIQIGGQGAVMIDIMAESTEKIEEDQRRTGKMQLRRGVDGRGMRK